MDVHVGEARIGELLDLLAMLGLARAADDRAGDVLTGERGGRLVEVAWQRQLLAELAFQSRVAPATEGGLDCALAVVVDADGELPVLRLALTARALERLDDIPVRRGGDERVADAA